MSPSMLEIVDLLFIQGLDGLQNALEAETRAKTEALRLKKKLESDVLDLETALDHANAANMETQKSIKGIQVITDRMIESINKIRRGGWVF